MLRKRTLTEKQVRHIRQLMADGAGVQEAADEYKLPYFTVYQIRRGWTYPNFGGPIIHRSRGRMTPEKAEKIRRLRERGASIDQLAKAAGVGRTTVKKALAGGV